ncbi:MAG: glucuronate isomerase [Bacillota bacterium]
MKPFMDENFLLETKTAEILYHDYAKSMPICDYHCHINVEEILQDKRYETITQVWLGGDHYKWRLMRLCGIDESYITGDKSDYEKFFAFATSLENAVGNPLYHWSHLELQRYFGIKETLNRKSAPKIYEKANKILNRGLTTRQLIKMSNVKMICSTDDPIDDLNCHIKLKQEGYEVAVLPTFRPDKAVNIQNQDFAEYINKLQLVSGVEIKDVQDICTALEKRLEFFISAGCVITDHAISTPPFVPCKESEASQILQKRLQNKPLSHEEVEKYQWYILNFLGEKYSENNLVMQIHMGALRNNSTRMFEKLGADTGFDSVGDNNIAIKLSMFLNGLDKSDKLPKTILYTLHQKDNSTLATMMGNFTQSGIETKVQFGTAWWFNDQINGITSQIKMYANMGNLSKFIGMLTDSRSFMSYTRHEYFRRILCNIIGGWVENGEFPQDYEILGKIISDISYGNIIKYIDKNRK